MQSIGMRRLLNIVKSGPNKLPYFERIDQLNMLSDCSGDALVKSYGFRESNRLLLCGYRLVRSWI